MSANVFGTALVNYYTAAMTAGSNWSAGSNPAGITWSAVHQGVNPGVPPYRYDSAENVTAIQQAHILLKIEGLEERLKKLENAPCSCCHQAKPEEKPDEPRANSGD